MEVIRKKDNRIGWTISIVVHIGLLSIIFLGKGCVEIQNPPQFTLEEVITLDFSDMGGGRQGSSSPTKSQPVAETPAPKVVTQEESPVSTTSSTSNTASTEPTEEVSEPVQQAKYNLAGVLGQGSGNDNSGNGQGEGSGIGTGKGPNTGGGLGDGKGRQVVGKPELANPKNWVGYVMVQFIIDANGNVISTKALYPHPETSISLTSTDKQFIENDCKKKFKFTPTSTGSVKDILSKRIQYLQI